MDKRICLACPNKKWSGFLRELITRGPNKGEYKVTNYYSCGLPKCDKEEVAR